eukprot:5208243-Amphidinium_carterae.1
MDEQCARVVQEAAACPDRGPSLSFKPRAVVLDVRAEEAFSVLHLSGAYNLPWDEITQRGFELPPRSVPMVVCCEDTCEE